MTSLKARAGLLAGGFVLTPAAAHAQNILTQQDDLRVIGPDPDIFLQVIVPAAMLFIVIVIAIALFFANQREKRKQDLIARFVDQGREIPDSLLPSAPSPERELRRGVWLAGWGIGIGLVLLIATGDWRAAAWSLILLFLSAASFLNAALFTEQPRSGRPAGDGD